MQGKHTPVVLLKAEGRCCPGFVLGSAFLLHPVPHTAPHSPQHWGHKAQTELLCHSQDDLSALQTCAVDQLCNSGQHSLQSYFMGLARAEAVTPVTAGDVIQNPLNKTSFMHAAGTAEPFPNRSHPLPPGAKPTEHTWERPHSSYLQLVQNGRFPCIVQAHNDHFVLCNGNSTGKSQLLGLDQG